MLPVCGGLNSGLLLSGYDNSLKSEFLGKIYYFLLLWPAVWPHERTHESIGPPSGLHGVLMRTLDPTSFPSSHGLTEKERLASSGKGK